jgi:CHAT domain-containing protein
VEGSGPDGPMAVPGTYTCVVEVEGKRYEQKLDVLKDPKSPATQEDIEEQIELALKIQEKVTILVKMGNSIEWIRKQIDDLQEYLKAQNAGKDILEASKALDRKFIEVEQKLFILRTTGASENLLRFPQQLYSHFKMLGYYVTSGDARPTRSKYEVFEELSQRLQQYQQAYQNLVDKDLKAFNTLLSENGILTINAMEQKFK